MEIIICRTGYRVGLHHNLSSADKWTDREGQHGTGGHVENLCYALTIEVGRISPTG